MVNWKHVHSTVLVYTKNLNMLSHLKMNRFWQSHKIVQSAEILHRIFYWKGSYYLPEASGGGGVNSDVIIERGRRGE
jgi:hypothetical protein